MTRSIAEWQKASFADAARRGEHSRKCPHCGHTPRGPRVISCGNCNDTGRVEVDHESPTRIAARLCMIHCAISRAAECVRKGEMELYFEGCPPETTPRVLAAHKLENMMDIYKPEGFPIELADVLLRTCDLAESLGVRLRDRHTRPPAKTVTDPELLLAALCRLHDVLPKSTCADFGFKQPQMSADLNHFMGELWDTAYETGIDLLAMAELKHSYNATLPYMHGKLI